MNRLTAAALLLCFALDARALPRAGSCREELASPAAAAKVIRKLKTLGDKAGPLEIRYAGYLMCRSLVTRSDRLCTAVNRLRSPQWPTVGEDCKRLYGRMIMWRDIWNKQPFDAQEAPGCAGAVNPGASVDAVCAQLGDLMERRDPKVCDKLSNDLSPRAVKTCRGLVNDTAVVAGPPTIETFFHTMSRDVWRGSPPDCSAQDVVPEEMKRTMDGVLRIASCSAVFAPRDCERYLDPVESFYCGS
ncbi:MAG TPA: hypothetical protein VH309_02790 [Elusimicrobiota bacterium]|jgi:hypothetical protein|nr:hypothetical protein [Elusimicrobiota bacterium]